eukprot:CAMPEP_0198149844 /NCGR_PEP_ID=MMETSP1443-20131203/48394_1 /TAXON_ID=186043 /ORGANISM="Entomoneis sp., Strain CCMP2396" /LENGTH=154 /DNA_ID=CAMNT_0043814989 /DNA_START=114 /DNA_END=578 /DNA_ORIENTATION=-
MDVRFEREAGDLYKELTNLGFAHEGIPEELGGSWSFINSMRWCRKQAAYEREHNYRQQVQAASTATANTTPNFLSAPSSNLKHESAHDKLRRKRAINLIHSRKKRERRQKEEDTLVEERGKFAAENKRLLTEHTRLKRLWEEATASVSSLGLPI